jgi:hypothetical protein
MLWNLTLLPQGWETTNLPSREFTPMTTNLKPSDREREKSPWFQVGQFLFLVALAVAVFMLAQSMVHHRFFQGGRIDRYNHIKQ